MPAGRFTPPPNDWKHLARTRRILTQGGKLRLMAVGDSIVNDTMRSGWIEPAAGGLSQGARSPPPSTCAAAAAPNTSGRTTASLDRCFRADPTWCFSAASASGLSQISPLMIEQLRAGLPEVEILLGTGAFGTTDPRDAVALAHAPHSGSGDYGRRLRETRG